MRKSLIKFILSNVKETAQFEDRMVQVLNHGLSGETAMDTLVMGYPTAISQYNKVELLKKLSRDGAKALDISKIKLEESTDIQIEYTAMFTRWFKDQESADDAVARGSRYDGCSYKRDIYPISADIQATDSVRFSLQELEDEGLVEVERV